MFVLAGVWDLFVWQMAGIELLYHHGILSWKRGLFALDMGVEKP